MNLVKFTSHFKAEIEHLKYSENTMNINQLESETMRLKIDDRARLAEKLLLSLDAPSEEENLQLWVAEAERRLRDLREGKAKEIPADEVLKKVRAAIV
jgi:putative addiction module component (TIGR02574 family)